MTPLPLPEEKPDGLQARYNITKTNGKPLDPEAEFFILRVDDTGKDMNHALASRIAVLAYADKIAESKPEMARDIYDRYNFYPLTNTPLRPPLHIRAA